MAAFIAFPLQRCSAVLRSLIYSDGSFVAVKPIAAVNAVGLPFVLDSAVLGTAPRLVLGNVASACGISHGVAGPLEYVPCEFDRAVIRNIKMVGGVADKPNTHLIRLQSCGLQREPGAAPLESVADIELSNILVPGEDVHHLLSFFFYSENAFLKINKA